MKLPLVIGFFAALVHVLSGPDHLAAVTPLALERERKYWKVGLAWGLGHILGMLLIGWLYFFMKNLIPVEKISRYSEQFVGIMLILIGCWALYRLRRPKTLTYPHTHHESLHIHAVSTHSHTHEKLPSPHNELAAFGIGVVHGFAGISHFILMLPVLGYTSLWQSVMYMLGFAAGIVSAMVLYVSILEKISLSGAQRSKRILSIIQYTGAFAAIVIGIFWIGRMG